MLKDNINDLKPLSAFGEPLEVDFTSRFLEDDIKIEKTPAVVIVKIGENHPRLQRRIFHLQHLLLSLHRPPEVVQTTSEWPVFALDCCVSSYNESASLHDCFFQPPSKISNLMAPFEAFLSELGHLHSAARRLVAKHHVHPRVAARVRPR
jgi:hypothetical protein